MPSQHSSVSEQQSQPSGTDPPPLLHRNIEILKNAHDFTMEGPSFIDNNTGNITLINNFNRPSNRDFMEKLLKETIPGAAFDSSSRYPPPRCHPGTRLAILERCLNFVAHCNGEKKMRWVVGAAGVGKSAIMQEVAESPQLLAASKASVFFSINGRDEGTKTIMTLSYQFAAKSEVYRRLIEDEIMCNPSLLQSSMPVQFEKFIINPFIYHPDLNFVGWVLVIIDGLDECSDKRTQVELLRLISGFSASYPTSPLLWLIASRPEPHITSFFLRPEVVPIYEKEDIAVDSNQARSDVEKHLRYQLTEIGKASDSVQPHWPDEQDLWKLASAAGGLFAYAQTVIRYIGNSDVGDPTTQLSEVLDAIDNHLLTGGSREEHPMAQLDALYTQILSKVPPKIKINVRKLLLALASNWDWALVGPEAHRGFITLGNWLGLTANEAYSAVNYLCSVLQFPRRSGVQTEALEPFHKSFIDYVLRSGIYDDVELEAQKIKTQCAFRVLKEAPSGIDFGDTRDTFRYGILADRCYTGDKIPITWLAEAGIDWDVDATRLSMYKLAIGEVAAGIKRGGPEFQNNFCISLMITRFQEYAPDFPTDELRDLVFDKTRSYEFMMHGILKQIPIQTIDISRVDNLFNVKLSFHRPVTETTPHDPWNSSCRHERTGQHEQRKEQNWTTAFYPPRCTFCFKRLKRQLESWITRSPAVSIMFTSTDKCCVELRFVDPEDDASEWAYWLWLDLSLGERLELGSTI